jgi:drug/metabolite transporter (DMT)-like permease
MLPLILLVILGIDWATGYAIAGYCMTHGVSPYGYAFWQAFGPFCLLLLIQTVRRKLWLNQAALAYAFFCAVFGIVIPNLLIYFAAAHVPSGVLTVLANTSPIFTYLLALVFKDEKFSLARCSLVVCGLVGVGLIIFPHEYEFKFFGYGLWLLVSILIPLCYAFSAVYIARFNPGGGDVLSYALWMLLFATLCISPLTVIKQGYYPLHFDQLPAWLIVGEVILSSLGYVLLFIILKMVGSVYYTLVNAIAALSGIVYGHFIFNQRFPSLTYLALALIMVTISGLTYTQKYRRASSKH